MRLLPLKDWRIEPQTCGDEVTGYIVSAWQDRGYRVWRLIRSAFQQRRAEELAG